MNKSGLERRGRALLVVLLALSGCTRKAKPDPGAGPRMLAYVRNLASDIGPRPAGSTAEAKARQYILAAFRQAGLQSQEDPVDEVRLSDSTDLVLHSANIVGVLEGKSPRSILIGAHHDSRNAACPGASDDASGVAVLLEAARRLAATPHRHTLVFASFTGEETAGLPGSREFLQSWKGSFAKH